jgi:copper chaperone CopZ
MTHRKSGKQFYLLTDDGVLQELIQNVFGFSLLLVSISTIPSLRHNALTVYWNIQDSTLATAHRYAWWSLLALLSSSCCLLQLILNFLSFGCAGFNNLLGPLRPTFLACTILLQASSWYVAWERPWQWKPTFLSTLLVLFTAFLPELLQCYSEIATSTTEEHPQETTHTYTFQMESVGCSACMVTVSGVLNNIPSVARYDADLQQNQLHVELTSSYDPKELLVKLEEVGFPMLLLEQEKEEQKDKSD